MKPGMLSRSMITAACAGLAMGLAACGSMPSRSMVAPTAVPDAAAGDASLRLRVEERVNAVAPDVLVRAEQGRIELRGTVRDAEIARTAVKEALSTEGVRGVVNGLDVAEGQKPEVPLIAAQ
jgi:osmotically-inducible protein OsmY